MNINIICVGKIKEKYITDAINEYSKRLSRFVKLTVTEVADEKIPDNASPKEMELVKKKEGEKILAKLPSDAFTVTLCVEGKEMPSPEIARKIADVSMRKSAITFIIGGSLGLSEEVKVRSQLRLSFGQITLPHQLIRVVLLEQLYRAYKINNNETYHK